MAMAKVMTEDQVRDEACQILGFAGVTGVTCGVGQITTFNQLGFSGVSDKPDGWYLPPNRNDVALVLEVKSTQVPLGEKCVDELLKNIRIVATQYKKVVGVLYNGEDVRVFKNEEEVDAAPALQSVDYYVSHFEPEVIDKEHIFELTARINNRLHFEFGIKNLYHRMIFTACALVARRYNALMVKGMDYSEFHNAILNCLNKELIRDKKQNRKLGILTEVFSHIEMNLDVESEDEKEQQRIKDLIAEFIDWVTEISDCLNSDAWRGEDVMGIFFNEFNRYKKKSEAGQVFTPEHITDFMYRIIEVHMDDRVLDAACGSGGFLVKAMANMVREAGGVRTDKAKEIKRGQLFGIEFDREIYALACANMLIHRDGKTNLEQLDARHDEAARWIRDKKITKVLMNPPFENKYGCMAIVENVLNSVPAHTVCAFILPDKKLEKASKTQMKRILKKHRLRKIIKLPESLFLGTGVATSIFIFETGIPQSDNEIFACYMADDGHITVKNKGRHDVHGKWSGIEDYWVDVVLKQSGDASCQWLKPDEHLSYQMPLKPFEITDEDFRRSAMEYFLFKLDIDPKEFSENLLDAVLYGSAVTEADDHVVLTIAKEQG